MVNDLYGKYPPPWTVKTGGAGRGWQVTTYDQPTKMRRHPPWVYYARWTRWAERLINEKGYWDEIPIIDQRWWEWMDRNLFVAEDPK